MPLFPRFVPHSHYPAHRAPSLGMDINTLLSSLLSADESNSSSYHHQSPSHASPAKASYHRRNSAQRVFTPSFDIIETQHAYVLEGELPGLTNKKAVDIEFTDQQTLLVKGKIEKHVTSTSTSTSAPLSSEPKQITSTEEGHSPCPQSPPKPTVEDDVDEDDDGRSTILTPASTVVSHEEEKKQTQQQAQKQKDQIRHWISERQIGSFQRTFSFPGLIDQDKVTAKLENGILTIVVPKRVKALAKKIEIL